MGKRTSRGLLNLIFSRRARGQGACTRASPKCVRVSALQLESAAAVQQLSPVRGHDRRGAGGTDDEVSLEGATLLSSFLIERFDPHTSATSHENADRGTETVLLNWWPQKLVGELSRRPHTPTPSFFK